MKNQAKYGIVITKLPRNQVYTFGGERGARYNFGGYINNLCKDPNCPDCPEVHAIIEELIEVDVGFRREWQKLSARYARVPQRQYQHAEYRRKRGKTF